MKKITLIILTNLIALVLCGQNLNVDKYPSNYNINNVVINDSVVKFIGGMQVDTDSAITVSLNIPVRCMEVRYYGSANTGSYKHISTFVKADYSTHCSSSGEMYGGAGYGHCDYFGMADMEYNITTYNLVVISGQLVIDSVKFMIDTDINVESEYIMGFTNGVASVDTTTSWNNGFDSGVVSIDTSIFYDNGVASVDTDIYWNDGFTNGVASIDTMISWSNGYNFGIASIDTDIYWNDGFTNGVTSVDTTTIYNNGVTYGLSQCDEPVDTSIVWSNGYNFGIASIDTDIYWNDGFSIGVASVDTTTSWNNGYLTGYNVGLDDCQSTGKVNMDLLDETIAYPNPTTDWITIDRNDVTRIEVYSIMGTLIDTYHDNTISLGIYNAGTYFLRVFTVGGELGVIKILRN